MIVKIKQTEKKPDADPHNIAEVICLECYYRWIAVYPQNTLLKQLECPKCGAIGFTIKTGQEIDASEWLR